MLRGRTMHLQISHRDPFPSLMTTLRFSRTLILFSLYRTDIGNVPAHYPRSYPT